MPFKEDSKRIVVYLRGKGQVGRVRAARLMQFANDNTLVVGPYYREVMEVKVEMSLLTRFKRCYLSHKDT